MDEIFGQDIALDERGQAKVAANGELVLTDGAETGVQDIRILLGTPLGSLFYQKEFGSRVINWVKEENTTGNRMAFAAEVVRRIHTDPRVKVGSATCRIDGWDETGLTAAASWRFIDIDHAFNLIVEVGENSEMVIKDGNPR